MSDLHITTTSDPSYVAVPKDLNDTDPSQAPSVFSAQLISLDSASARIPVAVATLLCKSTKTTPTELITLVEHLYPNSYTVSMSQPTLARDIFDAIYAKLKVDNLLNMDVRLNDKDYLGVISNKQLRQIHATINACQNKPEQLKKLRGLLIGDYNDKALYTALASLHKELTTMRLHTDSQASYIYARTYM